MGKMKRKRQKAHTAAVKDRAEKRDKSETTPMDADMEEEQHTPAPTQTKGSFKLPDNMFAGVKIDLDGMKRDLPDFDARSSITSKTLKGSNMTKVDKRKLKHDFWMKKVDAIQAAKKEDKERKKRRKTPVVGDLRGLVDALPTLDLLLKDNPVERARERERNKDRTSKKPVPKTKTRRKRMMDDIAIFNQVLSHPAFKSDPQATMKEHVKNWSEQQDKMQQS